MTREEMRAEFRTLLTRHYQGPASQRLVDDLADAASQYTAAQIEAACRPYPWPPPARRRGRGEIAATEKAG